jgi:hypothetical protein
MIGNETTSVLYVLPRTITFGGEDKRVMVNEDKREFMTETHDHFARTWPGLGVSPVLPAFMSRVPG